MAGDFYYIPYRIETSRGEECRCVDLPDDVPHAWLANQGPTFGLYEVHAEPETLPKHCEPVTGELANLLRSARDYPPALARPAGVSWRAPESTTSLVSRWLVNTSGSFPATRTGSALVG
ncbi:MAG: hypothetical protein V4850_25235 [Myxococcota bacterium]